MVSPRLSVLLVLALATPSLASRLSAFNLDLVLPGHSTVLSWFGGEQSGAVGRQLMQAAGAQPQAEPITNANQAADAIKRDVYADGYPVYNAAKTADKGYFVNKQLGYPDDYDGSFWLNTPGYYAPIWQGYGLSPEEASVTDFVENDPRFAGGK